MEKLSLTAFLAVMLACTGGVGAQDPCLAANHIVLSCETWRTTANISVSSLFCDTRFPTGWVRFDSPSGNTMLENVCPPLLSCGTVFPVWLNGTHPSVGDGIVTRRACGNVYGVCCQNAYTVHIKNCSSGDIVYKLPRVANCLGYCIGEQEPCSGNTSSATGYSPNCQPNYMPTAPLPCVPTTTSTTTSPTTSITTSPTTTSPTTSKGANDGNDDNKEVEKRNAILLGSGCAALLVAAAVTAVVVIYHLRRKHKVPSEPTKKVCDASSKSNDPVKNGNHTAQETTLIPPSGNVYHK